MPFKSYMASKHVIMLANVKIWTIQAMLKQVIVMIYFLIAAKPSQPDKKFQLLFNFARSR